MAWLRLTRKLIPFHGSQGTVFVLDVVTHPQALMLVLGAQDALLRLLDMSVTCGLPLDPLAGSCLKAIARWQVGQMQMYDIRVDTACLQHRAGACLSI